MINLLRSILFVLWIYGFMVSMGILCAPVLLGPRLWSQWVLQTYIKIVFLGLKWICGIHWILEGEEHIPEGGVLVAGQHQSMFDIFVPWVFLKDPAIVLKKELAYLPFFGWYALKLKNIVVDRKAGAKAVRHMLNDAKQRAQSGRQIVIFPQGTRATPSEKIKLQPGIAGLYKFMDVPCVPFALNSGEHWPGHGVRRFPGQIKVRILPAIPPGLDKDSFLKTLSDAMAIADQDLRK